MKVLMALLLLCFAASPVFSATSPTLSGAQSYSVLGDETVTNTGSTTTTGDVGVTAGSEITGFPPGIAGGDNLAHLHTDDASAIAAQADNLIAFGTLDQGCTVTYPGTKDLVGSNLVPGVYCADAFTLTGTLTLSGSGVWIFKSASTLVTSGTANVVGGVACDVWWRVVSSATLGTNTSLIGNILALTSITLDTGASLNGRALAQTGAVTMASNTISGPSCNRPTPAPTSSPEQSTPSAPAACVAPEITNVVPIIISSKRINPTSVSLSWGPYAGGDTFNVRYGSENGSWLYNTNVTGFSTTINDLPSNQAIWVQVANRNFCAIGEYSEAKKIGGQVLGSTTTRLAATGSTNPFVQMLNGFITFLWP